MPGRFFGPKPHHLRIDAFSCSKQARRFVYQRACFAFARFSEPATADKNQRGREKNHGSAWDRAEQNQRCLKNLLAENLVSVDYDRSISTKQEFLASVKRADVGDQQRGPDRRLARRRCGSEGRHLPGQRHAKRQAVLPALYERLAEPKWPMGMYCQPLDFDHALMVADS